MSILASQTQGRDNWNFQGEKTMRDRGKKKKKHLREYPDES